ncbi:MAG: DNA translocase FtsK 4TM domain-containing protein [Phascolarctobacterium sp.]|nr:DNA translocase FtsK 4TM domain-containing protein [Phascolarctobacterium sp.]
MPRKKKEVEIEQNIEEVKPNNTWRIVGIVLIIFGCLFTASFFVDSLSLFYKVEAVLFGKLAFILPLMLLALGFKMALAKKVGYFNKIVWGSCLLLICLLGACHRLFAPNDVSTLELCQRGGGFFGYMFVKGLGAIVGESAAGIIIFVLTLISLILLIPLWLFGVAFTWVKDLIFGGSDDDDDVEGTYVNKEDSPGRSERKSTYQKRERSNSGSSDGLDPRDIYNSSEFGSFNEGIKKESAYKKVLNFGKSGTYDDVKEEIKSDPLQIPEWEKNPSTKNSHTKWDEKKNISQGRIIHYEDLAGAQEQNITGEGTIKTNAQEEIFTISPFSNSNSVINNFYKDEQELEPKIFESQNTETEVIPEAQEVKTEVTAPVEVNSAVGTPIAQEVKPETSEPVNENEKHISITIEDSGDKIAGPVLSEAEAKAQETKRDEAQKPQSKYIKPPVSLLNPPVRADRASWEQGVKEQCGVLEKTLADFKVRAKVINVTRGPSVTRFELEPAPGVKVASIVNLADDIALRLAASGVRIEAPIPGKSAVGIEAPNLKNDMVAFREVVDTDVVKKDPSRLAIGLGKNISGDIISADLGKMPHTLIAGSTGSGKSVCVNTIIAGLLYKASPEEVKLILVDPKVVELSNYNGIPHLLTPVVTDPKKAASALRWGVNEMERRYQLFADNHVREITAFNKKEDVEKLPYIVIIIDELADLMMVAKVDVEEAILRLAQKARACGIHLILATQRPSVDVITGIVKANIPSRIAFAVSSQTDSRTILDGSGAEKLLGKGDMLFKPVGVNTPMRVQGAFVTDEELAKIVDFVKKQGLATEYNEEVTKVELSSDKDKDKASSQEQNGEAGNAGPEEDALFEDALRLVLDTGQVSSSMLQRRFRIGYTRAARLVDTFEELGIVGQSVGAKPREVIMSRQEVEERFLNR